MLRHGSIKSPVARVGQKSAHAHGVSLRLCNVRRTNVREGRLLAAHSPPQSVTSPNGVAHSYTYDTRNRLTNLAVNKSATALASYAYTLDGAGHRLSVSEL